MEKTVEKYGCIDCLVNNAGWRKLITDHSLITGLNGDNVFIVYQLKVEWIKIF